MFLRMSGRGAEIGAKAEIGAAALVEGSSQLSAGGRRLQSRAERKDLQQGIIVKKKNKMDEWQRG